MKINSSRNRVSGYMLPTVSAFLLVSGLIMLWTIKISGHNSLRINYMKIKTELRSELDLQMGQILKEGSSILNPSIQYIGRNGITGYRKISYWGLYSKAFIRVQKGTCSDSLEFIFGKSPGNSRLLGLVMMDKGDPLVLSGNVEIQGNSVLPKKGVIRSKMDGYALPENDCVEQIMGNEFDWAFLSDHFQEVQKFWEFEGKRFLKSFRPQPNSISNNSLVFCDKAIVPSWFEGSIQIIARNSIVISPGAKLKYPSSLAIHGEGSLKISNRSQVEGIVYSGENSSFFIQNQAQVLGEVYAFGKTDLRGEIIGSVFCPEPMYSSGSRIMNSHLSQARILPNQLPMEFCFTSHYPMDLNYEVIEFL